MKNLKLISFVKQKNKIKVIRIIRNIGSDVIIGIPEVKTLLNPGKVDELIEGRNIIDYSDPENQKASFTFEAELIDPTDSEEDQFKILGAVNQDIEEDIEFNLESTYPVCYMTKCTLPKSSNCNIEITCYQMIHYMIMQKLNIK